MNDGKRIQLLTDAEIQDIYSIPTFNLTDRQYYFALCNEEKQCCEQYKSIKSKAHFILLLGYFKASKQFHQFALESVQQDYHYIIQTHFSKHNEKSLSGQLWKENYRQQKTDVLRLTGYQEWSEKFKPTAFNHLIKLIRLYPKGHDTLREFCSFLENRRIILPAYRTLQDIFSEVFKHEKDRLNALIKKLPKSVKADMESLLANDEGITQLNIIRADQKDFNYHSIRSELKKVNQLTALYQASKIWLPSLQLSDNAVRYYAMLTEQYTASRLRKLSQLQQYLHTLCFIHYRYQEIMDNLIISFLVHICTLRDEAREYAREKENEHAREMVMNFPKLVEFLRWFSAGSIKPTTTCRSFIKKGFSILPKAKQRELAAFIEGHAFDNQAARWEFYQQSSSKIARYLRPILLAVNFDFYKPNSLTMALIQTLRDFYSSGSKSPKLLPKHLSKELLARIPQGILAMLRDNDKKIHPAKFEFYVYEKMYHQMDRGRLFCRDSVSYASLEDDLVPESWVDDAEALAKEYGYDKIPIYCDAHLDEKLAELDAAWHRTDQNITEGKNQHITIEVDDDGNSSWTLSYDCKDEKESATFFKGLKQMDVADMMKMMGDILAIWSSFSHAKHRYIKNRSPDPLVILACILADAFGFGIKIMAKVSNVSYHHLRDVYTDFIYADNMTVSNDIVSNYIHNLPVTRVWDLEEGVIIGDADGQKFETSRHTLQSRYSSKYFGTYKGISVYTLVVNNIPVNAKIIGPNEHESHHLYDIIYNNQSNVTVDKVTGDNHSINQINFVILDAINVAFIPGIKDIQSEAEKLYCVGDPSQYTGLIRPKGQIDTALIKSEKRGIIRVLLSLILQKNTQAIIVRKLSSHKRYSRLRNALWEYNKILKSTHVLNVIDNIQLRQTIRSGRNRTESYHQLHRTIRKIYSGAFKGRRKVDNAVSNHASRLVANLIIAYNAKLLNSVYLRLVKSLGEEVAKRIIARISPVAWEHIIFTGRYHFKSHREINFEELVDYLEQAVLKTR